MESGIPEEDEEDSSEFTALMEKSTTPENIDVRVTGSYHSHDEATALANAVSGWCRFFGAFLNLEGLEAVTVADDYQAALAAVNRGFPTRQAPTPTNDVFGSGLSMALPVLRNGVVKTHIILHSGVVRPIVDESNEYQQFAIHNLAHELAHAHDYLMESRAFPGAFGTTIPDFNEGILFQMAHACWNEYVASRLSARWGYDKYCKEFEDSLCPMLSTTRDRASASMDEYQKHRNMQKTANELVQVYGPLMTRLSYLVGHVHGINSTVEGEAPTLHRVIAETKWFAFIFRRYEEIVRAMYETYGKWTGLEVFESLKQMFDDLLKAGGMTLIQMPDGSYFIGLNRPRD